MIKKYVGLTVDGQRFFGNLLLPDAGTYPVVVLCHGIPGMTDDVGEKPYLELAEKIGGAVGIGAMAFSFRGTGSSQGNLDLLGWTIDLGMIVNYLTSVPEVDKARIYLLGYSAGAAVATYVAARDTRVAGVAACACPARQEFAEKYDPQSIVDYFRGIGLITDKEFPESAEKWLEGFKQVSPIDFIARVSPRPLLLVHGNKDTVVKPAQARKLFKAAGEPKELHIVEEAGHSLLRNEEATSAVIEWLKAKIGPVKAARKTRKKATQA